MNIHWEIENPKRHTIRRILSVVRIYNKLFSPGRIREGFMGEVALAGLGSL